MPTELFGSVYTSPAMYSLIYNGSYMLIDTIICLVVFGVLYLLYERWSARREGDRINHYAHIFGAVYGFVFPLLMSPSLIHVFLQGFRF